MKFYRTYNDSLCVFTDKYFKISYIYQSYYLGVSNKKIHFVDFMKNGKLHNIKNAAYNSNRARSFYLNGIRYGYENDFTKQSWRNYIRNIKLKVFL